MYLYDNIFISSELSEGLTETRYFNWLFNHPINTNFSFEEDSDLDGIPTGWELTNGILNYEIDKEKKHYLDITFTTGGIFNRLIDITNIPNSQEFYLYLDIKTITGDVDCEINLYYDSIKLSQNYHYRFRTGDYANWRNYFVKFESYNIPLFNKIEVKFYGDNTRYYIDNVSIIDDYKSINNPTDFSYNEKNNVIEIANLSQEKNIFLIPYKNDIIEEGITSAWTILNKTQLNYLKSIMNKKIILRTHDRKSITGKITEMSVDYIEDTIKKVFKVNLNIDFF
jgi:hypothetical protein